MTADSIFSIFSDTRSIFMPHFPLGACLSNRKIPILGGLFTLDRTEIVKPEPIVCVENFHL